MWAYNSCIIVTLVAVFLGSNYVLVGVPNVKFISIIVFIGGFCFGPLTGPLIGAFSWEVYGTINPHDFVLHVWLATMFSELVPTITAIRKLIGGAER